MTAHLLPFPDREVTMDDTLLHDDGTAAWRDLDVVDTAAFDDAYFSQLAGSIEDAVDAATVVPLWRRLAPVAAAVAALLALGVGLSLLGPSPSVAPTEAGLDAELIAAAKAVGAAAGSTLFDEELDTNLYASLDWLDSDEDLAGTYNSLLRELDEVPGSELRTLLTPL